MSFPAYSVVVIGGGHAGVEAAWSAAGILGGIGTVALVTLDVATIGVMSCNPANGGLAKGQLVREIDAMGGVMGLATDSAGIQFKVLNTSKGPAVWGPRAQCDKHAYAESVRAMIGSRPEIVLIAGAVEDLVVEGSGPNRRIVGVVVCPAPSRGSPGGVERGVLPPSVPVEEPTTLRAGAVVLTTGTFMRGLMHTGDVRSSGGRHGEASAVGIGAALERLGFELGRLKTGTPPRIRRGSIDWDGLPAQPGDEAPSPMSDLSGSGDGPEGVFPSIDRFPVLPQVECRITGTTAEGHALVRENLHRAPMFSGQIEGVGPRYCPSIEDKVVRFSGRDSHTVFLEPESLRDDWVYCNGIATSLPVDVQERLVRAMPGCARAEFLRHGYAVEYDMVRPHQIDATAMTRSIGGLFLAGQINGTSGYEEAAAQGVVAGINGALWSQDPWPGGAGGWVPDRSESYIGVLMDDLVTKTPREPYRMFTSRAEHRLLLRADNASDRLTPLAERLGLLGGHVLGGLRRRWFAERSASLVAARAAIEAARVGGEPLQRLLARPEFGVADLAAALGASAPHKTILLTLLADRRYAGFVDRQRAEIGRQADASRRRLPRTMDFASIPGLRAEARQALERHRPETFGQAGRLEGITPADLTVLAVHARRVAAV